MITKEKLLDIFNNLSESEQIEVNNQFCEANRYYDDIIYPMSEFDMMECNSTPTEVLNSVDADFNINDDYFKSTVFGWSSADYPYDEGWFDENAIVNWLMGSENDCGIDELEEYFHDEWLNEISGIDEEEEE